MLWARTENGLVHETSDIDPTGRFHPDLLWKACPLDTQPGWLFIDDVFSRPPDGSASEQIDAERKWQNFELNATEWLILRHRDEQDQGAVSTLTPEQYSELLSYRQALRDWPQTDSFPVAESRPIAPPWLAAQTQ
jgi:hypothetical protein